MTQLFIPRQAVQLHSGSRFFGILVGARWIGRWIMTIAAIQLILTPILFPAQVQQLLAMDIVNTGFADPEIGRVVWFFLYSFPLLIVGHMIDRDEKRGDFLPYQETMISMVIIMTSLGIILIPVSGFWMMIPAIVGLIAKNRVANKRY